MQHKKLFFIITCVLDLARHSLLTPTQAKIHLMCRMPARSMSEAGCGANTGNARTPWLRAYNSESCNALRPEQVPEVVSQSFLSGCSDDLCDLPASCMKTRRVSCPAGTTYSQPAGDNNPFASGTLGGGSEGSASVGGDGSMHAAANTLAATMPTCLLFGVEAGPQGASNAHGRKDTGNAAQQQARPTNRLKRAMTAQADMALSGTPSLQNIVTRTPDIAFDAGALAHTCARASEPSGMPAQAAQADVSELCALLREYKQPSGQLFSATLPPVPKPQRAAVRGYGCSGGEGSTAAGLPESSAVKRTSDGVSVGASITQSNDLHSLWNGGATFSALGVSTEPLLFGSTLEAARARSTAQDMPERPAQGEQAPGRFRDTLTQLADGLLPLATPARPQEWGGDALEFATEDKLSTGRCEAGISPPATPVPTLENVQWDPALCALSEQPSICMLAALLPLPCLV